MTLVIGDAELQPNDSGDARTGPDIPPKAISLRSVPQELWDAGQLLGRQFRRTAGGGVAVQRLGSRRFRDRQPSADGTLIDAKGGRDIDFQPAQFVQLKGSEPSPFSASSVEGEVFHPSMLTEVALFAQRSVNRVRLTASSKSGREDLNLRPLGPEAWNPLAPKRLKAPGDLQLIYIQAYLQALALDSEESRIRAVQRPKSSTDPV